MGQAQLPSAGFQPFMPLCNLIYTEINFPMANFILSTLYTALLLPFFLRWGRQQAEAQIDKMQESVFNTPGAEAPVPPLVLVGGLGLIASHFFFARRFLRLKGWQAFLSWLLGLLWSEWG